MQAVQADMLLPRREGRVAVMLATLNAQTGSVVGNSAAGCDRSSVLVAVDSFACLQWRRLMGCGTFGTRTQSLW